MKPRRRTPLVGMLAASASALVFVGGCANPRGTASAFSPVQPLSSAAVSSTEAPSPAQSSPAPASPVTSTSVASGPPASSSSAGSTNVLDSTQIYGAVTAASERQLVVTYLGGDCDTSARGEAVENESTITVHVSIASSNGVCDAVGYVRTVVVQLSAPWGNRVVRDLTGATVPVVDGALLVRPSWLPGGYQGGGISVGASGGGKAAAAQEWGPPTVTATSAAGEVSCPPTPGVSLIQGYGIAAGDPAIPGSYSLADGTAITVTRDQFNDLDLYWTPPGHLNGWTIALQSTPQCGSPVVSLNTLLKIANGLR